MLTPSRALTHADLELVESPAQAQRVFELLGYQVESEPLPVSLADLQLSGRDQEAVESFHLLSSYGDDFLIGLWQLNDLSGVRLRSLSQNFLARGTDCLFIATNREFNPIIFVSPRRVSPKKTKVFKLVVDRYHPTRHDLDVLEKLRVRDMDVAQILAAHREAFNVDRVTKRFYEKYALRFRQLQEALTRSNKGVKQFQGNTADDRAFLHAFAQRLMGRLMFLYFIQKKGWLADNQRFLTHQFQALQKGQNYYRDVLEPLFFEILSTPEDARKKRAVAFGDIPYLNGGLFEKDYDFLLHLDNAVFDPDAEDGLLSFFNSYNFTVTEDTPLEVEVALDPEMLGKVFENLLEAVERGQDGTFYTPRVIVNYMCREALAEHLKDETGLEEGLLRALVTDPEEATLKLEQAKKVEKALSNLRCLDPAVGSGAFLVGMLQEMVAIRHACFRAGGAEASQGSSWVAAWKREIIQECLYGVDIKREAIEIAKLRLWLSLVVDLRRDQIEPLPNLDFKLMDGNSLIETLGGQPILGDGPRETLSMSDTDTVLEELHHLKDAFFAAVPSERSHLVEQIRAKEAEVVDSHVQERLQLLDEAAGVLLKRRKANGSLKPKDAGRLEALLAAKKPLVALDADIRRGASLPFFLYGLHFCEVFQDKNGFDIVIANPPYVATQAVNQLGYRDELEAQFGYRRDLYVHFLDRALGLTENAIQPLLKPGGVLSFITSGTYFSQEFFRQLRSGQAEPNPRRPGQPWSFRRGLLQCNILKILDCPPIFDATVNTAVVVLRNEAARKRQELTYIGASRLDQVLRRLEGIGGETLDLRVQECLGAMSEDFSHAAEQSAGGKRVWRAVQGGIPIYRAPLALFQDCISQGIFEPAPALLQFYDKYMRQWVETVNREFEVDGETVTLWEMVQSSRDITKYAEQLAQYRSSLQPGDVTILGAVTEGGQGLATADNGRFLAYLGGTPEALNVLGRNEGLEPDESGAYPNSDWGEGGVRRTISPEQVAPARYMTSEYQRQGIPEPVAHWVPYEKGDPEGNRWARINNCYIDWSEDSVRWMYEHSGRKGARMPVVRNPQFYFREGFCWSVRLTDFLKARWIKPCVQGHKAMYLTSALDTQPSSVILACLNSRLLSLVIREFIRSPQSFEMNDARAVPLVVTDERQRKEIDAAVTAAVAVQERCLDTWTQVQLSDEALATSITYQKQSGELATAEAKVDALIAALYGLPVPEDPVDELARLAEAELASEADATAAM